MEHAAKRPRTSRFLTLSALDPFLFLTQEEAEEEGEEEEERKKQTNKEEISSSFR